MNLTLRVWLPSHAITVPELHEMIKTNPNGAAGFLAFTDHDMAERGWTEVGTAAAAVTLLRRDDATRHQISVLREQIDKIHAEAQTRVNLLEDRIKTLAALEWK